MVSASSLAFKIGRSRLFFVSKDYCFSTDCFYYVSIGNDTFVGDQVLITGAKSARVIIGDDVDIAPRVVIVSGTHKIDMVSTHSAGKGMAQKSGLKTVFGLAEQYYIAWGNDRPQIRDRGGSVVIRDIPHTVLLLAIRARP